MKKIYLLFLSLCCYIIVLAQPANDVCTGAVVIPAAGPFPYTTAAVSNADATDAGDPVSDCQSNSHKGVWYTFNPSVTGDYTISTCQSAAPLSTISDNVLGIYTSTAGCSGPFTQVICDDDACTTLALQAVATATLTSGTTYYILVSGYNANTGNAQLNIGAPVTCFAPTNLSSSATATTASISFTGTGTFILEYGLAGFTPGTGATAGTGGTVINPATSPQTIGSLTANTAYSVYIRAVCGDGTYSANTAVYNFTTACLATGIPYTMPIETATQPNLPECTSMANVAGDESMWFTNIDINDIPGFTAPYLMYVYSETQAANDWLFTRGLTLTGGISYRLNFKYNNDGSVPSDGDDYYPEKLKVMYGTSASPSGMTLPLADYPTVASATPQFAAIDFTPPSTGTYYIGFQAYSDANQDALILDDISVIPTPACSAATNVQVTANGTTATVSWVGSGSYLLEYGPAGYTPGTDGSAGATGTLISPATSPQAITGLTSGSTYDVYVRQNCTVSGNGYSLNSPKVTFIVAPSNDVCSNAVTIPCGGSVSGDNTYATTKTLPSVTCGSTSVGRFHGLWYKITPAIAGLVTVSTCSGTQFDTYLRAYTGTDCENLTVCAGSDDDGCSEVLYGLSSLTFTATANTTYYILIGGYDIDDFGAFTISATCPSACATPTGVTAGSVTTTGASISWTGTGTYILEYGLTGFTPGTGATAGVGGTVINPATSPQAISGLASGTAYTAYVRQDCVSAGNGYSANASVAFTTLAAAPVNDAAPGAIQLTVGAGCSAAPYTNVGATQEADEKFASCFQSATTGTGITIATHTVWFKFQATSSAVRVSTDITGGTLSDTHLALYSIVDPFNYATFNIISCDDDNGVTGTLRSTLYATGLTAGQTYYISVDGYNGTTGTFCLAVDNLASTMLAATPICSTIAQTPSGSQVTYTGQVPLVDAAGNLIAIVRNPAGGAVNAYGASSYKNTGAVRKDNANNYYLDRNYLINNTTATNVEVQFFFTNAELTSLTTVDPTIGLTNLGAFRQAGTTCVANYNNAGGSALLQSAYGTQNNLSWIQVTTPSFSNFYLTKAAVTLPITIEYFRGVQQNGSNNLNWKINSSDASVSIALERSIDGIAFSAINSQSASADRCILPFNYADLSATATVNYYRLKLTDLSGKITYSQVVVLMGKEKGFELSGLQPNPVNETAILKIVSATGSKIELSITDVAGKRLSNQNVTVIAGLNKIPMNFAKLAAGTYQLTGKASDGTIKTIRFVKQ